MEAKDYAETTYSQWSNTSWKNLYVGECQRRYLLMLSREDFRRCGAYIIRLSAITGAISPSMRRRVKCSV